MSASTLVPPSLAQRLLSTIAAVALVLGLVRVGPLAPSMVQAASGAGATVRLTLDGRPDTAAGSTTNPDTFGAVVVATGTKPVGVIFPVSVIIDTDGAAVNAFKLQVSYNATDFHIVSPLDGSDITSFPNTSQTKGSVGMLFQNAGSFPGAGPTNVVDNATGSAIIAYGGSTSDTDTQIYSQTDSSAPTGYHNGLDRVMTMYFKAMRSVTSGNISFAADSPTTTQQLIRYGDWMDVGTASETDIYVDADINATVSAGDVRLTAVVTAPGYAAGTTVTGADTDTGTALAGGRLAGAMYRDVNSNTTFDVASEPVYVNLDYPNAAVSAGDLRVAPTGLAYAASSAVAGGDTDVGGALLPLANARQTGSGGLLTDLIGTAGVNLVGATVTGTPPTSAITTAAATCAQTGSPLTVTVTTTPVMQGVPVTLTSSDMTGLTITPVAPTQNATTAQTNASGVATFSVTGTSAGARTFTGTAGGVAATASASVTFQAGACGGVVSATTSTVTSSPACVVSNGVASSTITVTLRDSGGTAVSGATVSLGQGAGSSVITGPTYAGGGSSTNSTGVATFTVVNTTAQTVTYTATANGTTVITQTAQVQFASSCGGQTISGTNSSISASPSACVVNGASTTVTVTVRDTTSGGGAVVSGATVTLVQSGSAIIAAPNPTTTNASGQAVFTVSSATAQTVNFTASATNANGTAAITPSPAVSATWAASCAATYSISGTISGASSAATISVTGTASGSTTSSGAYTVSNLPSGSYTVTPTLTGCTFSPVSSPVTITSANVTGVNFTATCSSTTYSISGTISGASSAATISVTGTASGSTTSSGAYTVSNLPSGSYTVTPTLTGCTFSPVSSPVTITSANVTGVNFTATCSTLSGTNSRIDASPNSCVVTNSGSSTVTVNLRDSGNAAFTGSTNVTLLASPSTGVTITPTSRTGITSGSTTFTVSSSLAQSVTFTASAVSGATVTVSTPTNANGNVVNFQAACTSYSITGTVSGTSGTVTVTAVGPSTQSGSTISGGSYTIGNLPNGSYTVTPSLSGCTFTPSSTPVTISSANVNGVNFTANCSSGTASLSLSPYCVVANGTNTNVNLTFSGTGTTGAPVSNINVSPSANLTLNPTSGTTSGSGQLSTTINISSGAALGARTLYATINSSTVSASLNVVSSSTSCGTSGTGALATSTKTATNRDKIFKAGNSVDFTLMLRNTNTTTLTDVSVLDTKDRGWDSFNTSSVTVSPSSGTQANTSSQISLSNVTVSGSSSTSVLYTQKLKSGSNLLDDLDIDQAADPALDTDWWAENVVTSEVQSSDYDNEDDVLDVSDTNALSLGGSSDPLTDDLILESDLDSDSSYVIVDFGDRVIVNTSGDDFFIKEQHATDDTDTSDEKYAVYASQDGVTFSLLSKNNTGAKTFDLGKSDYDWARELLIVDQTDDTDADGEHPGIDIESIGLIHIGGLVKNTASIQSAAASSTANPSETIAVDVTSIMDEEMDPCAFGVGTNCSTTFSTVYSRAESADPCFTLAGGNITFTLRDVDNVVVPNQAITITALPADGVTIQTSPSTTDANGRITVRVASSKVQDVVFTFSATPSGSTTPMSVLTYTGVFKTSCTLARTGVPSSLAIGLLVVSALPAAWVARRRWMEV